MADWPITVNSAASRVAYHKIVDALIDEHRYVTFPKPRIGPDRSLDQNALFHCWLTECAAYYLSKHAKEVTENDIESMKITVKRHYYAATGAAFMVEEVQDIWRGKSKQAMTSSKRWSRGEMFDVLTWLQYRAANDELILESKGEYAKLQRSQSS